MRQICNGWPESAVNTAAYAVTPTEKSSIIPLFWYDANVSPSEKQVVLNYLNSNGGLLLAGFERNMFCTPFETSTQTPISVHNVVIGIHMAYIVDISFFRWPPVPALTRSALNALQTQRTS